MFARNVRVRDLPSYMKQLNKPTWGLYTKDNEIVASIRADNFYHARNKFKKELTLDQMSKGFKVKRIPD